MSAGLLAGTGSAVAAPSGCTVTRSGNTASALCTHGSGSYRVVLLCEDGITGAWTTQYGPYVTAGHRSAHQCYPPQRTRIRSAHIQFR